MGAPSSAVHRSISAKMAFHRALISSWLRRGGRMRARALPMRDEADPPGAGVTGDAAAEVKAELLPGPGVRGTPGVRGQGLNSPPTLGDGAADPPAALLRAGVLTVELAADAFSEYVPALFLAAASALSARCAFSLLLSCFVYCLNSV